MSIPLDSSLLVIKVGDWPCLTLAERDTGSHIAFLVLFSLRRAANLEEKSVC
jgi:hypothetical protein